MATVKPVLCITNTSACNKLCFADDTGEYIPGKNPYGWNGVNTDIDTILTATIQGFERQSDGLFTPGTVVNVFDTLPNITGEEICLTFAQLGLSGEDGIYQFQYILTGGEGDDAFSIPTTFTFVNDCAWECCLKKAAANYAVGCCDSTDPKYVSMLAIDAALENAKSPCCFNAETIMKLLEKGAKCCADCAGCSGCH